jgi:hypothetical protein
VLFAGVSLTNSFSAFVYLLATEERDEERVSAKWEKRKSKPAENAPHSFLQKSKGEGKSLSPEVKIRSLAR